MTLVIQSVLSTCISKCVLCTSRPASQPCIFTQQELLYPYTSSYASEAIRIPTTVFFFHHRDIEVDFERPDVAFFGLMTSHHSTARKKSLGAYIPKVVVAFHGTWFLYPLTHTFTLHGVDFLMCCSRKMSPFVTSNFYFLLATPTTNWNFLFLLSDMHKRGRTQTNGSRYHWFSISPLYSLSLRMVFLSPRSFGLAVWKDCSSGKRTNPSMYLFKTTRFFTPSMYRFTEP
ncbi:hypothetical protein QBC38DRAFT_282058 [Podospora fimiseda]|uniref:Uncharacterized protein n=1 Tax=Podospora fimiseda TaxID=252190 RepID=A0AAN7BKQ7_9PEZI|nr:hypothetical protein QBC38DRAFT_282058 [Podospora fimiseda]